ncbi:acyl-CoA desaturase [Enterovibrio nigricans]|uniref:Stearoyl-CoA desaturase (Delta-9 desaturase) n=1 Tax=Enterovibrio nigricans DSM 22720 TaxID=1121868 RepID=A0A1T4UIA1_9GAMM|nr:fatty acid desaturase [Enterovibrio nigricans]PKF48921.1 acyl-CoA desaturase [Enterovibrio nigricans]SKA52424.1 stearoyl-CoA desaturase (delta-9 desaturase) [Enterovibrio nigricans DSM 22720]
MESNQTQKPPIIWLNVAVFVITFAVAAIGTPLWAYYHGFDGAQIAMFALAFTFGGISITAGYHRLWSHKAYDAHPVLKAIFALGGAFAIQNSILHWSSDHRIHHRHVDDNDVDPYSAKRGFWYSHIGWMLREYQKHRYTDYTNCRDLQKDKIVMWQHKHYLALVLATNFGIPIAFGLIHGDIWGAIILIGFTRLVMNHHTTFFINSLAHIWGSQPYTQKNTARDNGILALFTFGEGYHNFHHIFENDYRNGIHWWQFDPTKWLIKSASWVGLAQKLRKTPADRIEKAKATMLLKNIQDHLSVMPNATHRLQIIEQEYDALVSRMSEYYEAQKRLIDLKKKNLLKKYEKAILIQQLQILKFDFKKQKRNWLTLTSSYA